MRLARRSRRALIVALPVLLLPTLLGTAHADPLTTFSPAPPYLSGLGTTFRATSNGEWGTAKALSPDMSNNPLNKPPGEGDPFTEVWTSTCKKDGQKVTFTRKLRLPGLPVEAEFAIAPIYSIHPSPFKSYSAKLNGTKIAGGSLSGSSYAWSTTELGGAARTLFTDGKNKLAVQVKRGKLPKGFKKCNTAETNKLRSVFLLSGDFEADLALVDQDPAPLYYAAAPTNTAIINLTLRNLGPSGVTKGGEFRVDISGITEAVNLSELPTPLPGTFPAAPPFEDCEMTTVTPAPNLSVRVDCPLSAMKAGDEGVLSLGVVKEHASTEFTEAYTHIAWQTGHPVDSVPGNNVRGAQLVWCGTLATSPGCVDPSPPAPADRAAW